MKKLITLFFILTTFAGCSGPTHDERQTVYVTPTGKCYHYKASCAGSSAYSMNIEDAQQKYNPCKKCVK